jgi:hypothetical protein
MLLFGRRSMPMQAFASPSPDPSLEPARPTDNIRTLRRHPRQRTSLRAILNTAYGFQSTTVRDVSRGGVGLEGTGSFMPGDRVELHLLTGQRYPGVVRWWCRGHCGIAFDEMLDPEDALLVQADRRRRPPAPKPSCR